MPFFLHTDTRYTTPEHRPIHFSLHHSKQYCPRPRMPTPKHPESTPPPLDFCYHKAEKYIFKKERKECELCGVKLTSCENRQLWLLQDLRTLYRTATSGRGWSGRSNIKASDYPKALEQFQSRRKTPLNSVPPLLVPPPPSPLQWVCCVCAFKFLCLFCSPFAAYCIVPVLLSQKIASNLPQSIASFEDCKISCAFKEKNAQLSFIDRKRADEPCYYATPLYK